MQRLAEAGGRIDNYRDFNRDTYARGRETFDATYAAFKRLLLGIWRREELAARTTEAEATVGALRERGGQLSAPGVSRAKHP